MLGFSALAAAPISALSIIVINIAATDTVTVAEVSLLTPIPVRQLALSGQTANTIAVQAVQTNLVQITAPIGNTVAVQAVRS